jgi:hypothetical protein
MIRIVLAVFCSVRMLSVDSGFLVRPCPTDGSHRRPASIPRRHAPSSGPRDAISSASTFPLRALPNQTPAVNEAAAVNLLSVFRRDLPLVGCASKPGDLWPRNCVDVKHSLVYGRSAINWEPTTLYRQPKQLHESWMAYFRQFTRKKMTPGTIHAGSN